MSNNTTMMVNMDTDELLKLQGLVKKDENQKTNIYTVNKTNDDAYECDCDNNINNDIE